MSNTNVGNSFPLEKLDSDLARNSFNYESILNGLIAWDKSMDKEITIRLSKDSDPYFEDYTIPTKSAIFELNEMECELQEEVVAGAYGVGCKLESALYGGSVIHTETSFNAEFDVNDTTDEIILLNASGFFVQDKVIFEPQDSATVPVGMNKLNQYVIESVDENTITLLESDGITPLDITGIGSGTIKVVKLETSPTKSEEDPGDVSITRVTVKNNGDVNWGLYYSQIIDTWTSGKNYKFGRLVFYNDLIYKVLADVNGLTNTPFEDLAHYEPLVKEWTIEDNYSVGDLVSDEGDLFLVIEPIFESNVVPRLDNRFISYAPKYNSLSNYSAGTYVFYDKIPYVAKKDIVNSTGTPDSDNENWEMTVLLPIPVSGSFEKSTVVKWYVDIDIAYIVLKNLHKFNKSTSNTDISIKLSVKFKEPASIYQRSVDLLPTSNYAFWPLDKSTVWDTDHIITEGSDEVRPISERQDYSAVMIFDHTNAELSKTVNFINYDGPDLDQGLCIYLPSESPIGADCIAEPEDGFTFEFYFRIWPNVKLTDDVTRDHIINKSQIYVYSAPTVTDVKENNCGNPIAKFSMARTTNFYVFGENIAIPDKPVCYRATFIYSKIEGRWITLDYYQLPDHVFLGPVGFIDPQNPANLDVNKSVIGNINPNAANIGYETGAFPLYQDPFSNPDLSPFRLSDDSDFDAFKNRIP